MTLPRFAVAQCGCMDDESQCSRKLLFRQYYLGLFLQVALSHTKFTGPRGAHKRQQGYIYSYHRVQNSCQQFTKTMIRH